MSAAYLEHANITATDADSTAELLCKLFDWSIRWSGAALSGGRSVHVGSEHSYIALYSQPEVKREAVNTYSTAGMANHLGVVVDDLDATEQRILAEGLKTDNHADYEPGRRFYFHLPDGLEIEVCSYQS